MKEIGGKPDPCPACGWSFGSSATDRRRHAHYHRETLYGIKVKRWGVGDRLYADGSITIARVTRNSPTREIGLAARVAIVANRRPHFDFQHFGRDTFSLDPRVCCLLTLVPETYPYCRVIGIAVLCTLRRVGGSRWSDFIRVDIAEPALWWPRLEPIWLGDSYCDTERNTAPEARAPWNCDRVQQYVKSRKPMGLLFAWVVPTHRRQGIARKMLEVAAATYGQEPSRLPLVPPFTDDARAAAMQLFPSAVVIGEPIWSAA